MALNQAHERVDHRGRVIDAGQVIELFPTCAEKGVARFLGDFFEGLEAIRHKPRADDIDPPYPLASQGLKRRLGVGLEPGGPTEARLEGDHPLVLGQAQALREQARHLVTLTVIGVALHQRAVRHPMEAHDQAIWPALFVPCLPDIGGNGLEVSRVVMKIPDQAELRQITPRSEFSSDLIKNGPSRRTGILRIHGQHKQTLQIALAQGPHHAAHRRVAVTHRHCHLDRMAAGIECGLQALRLALGVDP